MKIKLEPKAIMPTRAFKTDAGLDLYSRETKGMEPGQSAVFDTGVHMEFPHGYYGRVEGRSGLNVKYGIVVPSGIIDESYRGSIIVKLYNLSDDVYIVSSGDRIAQLIISEYVTPTIEIVEELDKTERGDSGIGSSGT